MQIVDDMIRSKHHRERFDQHKQLLAILYPPLYAQVCSLRLEAVRAGSVFNVRHERYYHKLWRLSVVLQLFLNTLDECQLTLFTIG